MALVTIEEFAGYLKQDLDEFDAYTAQFLLDGASEAVQEYCGWHIAPVLTETVIVDGTGTQIQTLPTLGLVSVETVSENGVSFDPAYLDWSTNGVLEKRRGGYWTARRRGVVTGITHGLTAAPGWVKTLICAAAGRAFYTPLVPVAQGGTPVAAPQQGVVTQEASGGESVTYASPQRTPTFNYLATAPVGSVTLLPFELRMLDRLRVPAAP